MIAEIAIMLFGVFGLTMFMLLDIRADIKRSHETPSAGERRLMERLNSLSIITNLTLENTMTAIDDLKAAETRREASDARLEAKLKTVQDQLAALIAANGDSIPAADVQAVVAAMNAETDSTDAAGADTPTAA